MFRLTLTVALLLTLSHFADAGSRRCRSRQCQPCQHGSQYAACTVGSVQQGFENPVQPASFVEPARVMPSCPPGQCPTASTPQVLMFSTTSDTATDAIDEVNAYRSQRGLRPFLRDDSLVIAARAAATYRAMRRIDGHVSGGMSDFRFLPAGANADAAGCAAGKPEMGWGSCCTTDNYQYAGAAWAMGADGRRYMHLFVR